MENYTFLLIFFTFFILSHFPLFLFILTTKSKTKSRFHPLLFPILFELNEALFANFHDPCDPSIGSIRENPSRAERGKLKTKQQLQQLGLRRERKTEGLDEGGSPFFEDGMDASAARADPSFLIKLSEARFLVPVASRLEARDRFTRAGNRELEVGWTL